MIVDTFVLRYDLALGRGDIKLLPYIKLHATKVEKRLLKTCEEKVFEGT